MWNINVMMKKWKKQQKSKLYERSTKNQSTVLIESKYLLRIEYDHWKRTADHKTLYLSIHVECYISFYLLYVMRTDYLWIYKQATVLPAFYQ